MAQDLIWSEASRCMRNAVPMPARATDQMQAMASRGAAPAFSYAFQPIVDTVAREVFSYEALIRGRGVFLDANRVEVHRLDGSRARGGTASVLRGGAERL